MTLAPTAPSAPAPRRIEQAGVERAPAEGSARAGRVLPPDVEQELVSRAQAGDREAFREIYEHFAPPVYRSVLLPLVRDTARAEDLLADTFVRALENLHRFRWQPRGILPWLARIGKNLALDQLRRRGRATPLPEDFERFIPDPTDWNAETLLARDEIGAVLAARTEACLGELRPRYRRVITLRIVQRRPRAEAAEEMGVSVGTLDVLLCRACKAFRKIYAGRYGADGQDPFTSVP